jgi:hypothetical protein
MLERVHDEFGAFTNELTVKRLARTDLRAKPIPAGSGFLTLAKSQPIFSQYCEND